LEALRAATSRHESSGADEESRPDATRHQELLLNRFGGEGEISSGAVESVNDKIPPSEKLIRRLTFVSHLIIGFTTLEALALSRASTSRRTGPWARRSQGVRVKIDLDLGRHHIRDLGARTPDRLLIKPRLRGSSLRR
jgi:hypothetical protein